MAFDDVAFDNRASDPAPALVRSRRMPLALIVLAVLTAAGCAAPSSSRYVELYDRGVREFQLGNFPESRAIFQNLLDEYPDAPFNQYVSLRIAACDFSLRNVDQAREVYLQFIESIGDLRLQALEDLGNLELIAENFDQAAEYLARAAEQSSSEEDRLRISYRRGISLQQGGSFGEARQVFESISSTAPGSKWAESASARLAMPEYFTVQIGAYSRAENAERQRKRLEGAGFTSRVEATSSSGQRLYRVWMGRYSSRRQAIEAKDRLTRAGVLEAGTPALVIP